MIDPQTVDRFSQSVVNHKAEVLLDVGFHRHVRCAAPGDSNMWFEVISWPGRLVVSGDMGTYLFARSVDMFALFRSKVLGAIDCRYVVEKCEAADCRFGTHAFSDARLRTCIDDLIEIRTEEFSLSDADVERIRYEMRDVFPDGWFSDYLEEDRSFEAKRRLNEFSFETRTGKTVCFGEYAEQDLTEITSRFQWIVLAACWAVREYDATKTA